MKITAVLAIRNEEKYLRIVLNHLVKDGIRLAILDNDSTDSSTDILNEFSTYIDHFERIPYSGKFHLSQLMEAKSKVYKKLDTDWIIHHDADEILQSSELGESLSAGIKRVSSEGCNAINFDEFVFIPTKETYDYEGCNFYKNMLNYYFFEPYLCRLMRAWKNVPHISQKNGGHILTSEKSLILPKDSFILRHYILLNKKHAMTKYFLRQFADEDLCKGWHANRVNFPMNVIFPSENELHKLTDHTSRIFVKNHPWKKHFWEINQIN